MNTCYLIRGQTEVSLDTEKEFISRELIRSLVKLVESEKYPIAFVTLLDSNKIILDYKKLYFRP